MSVGDVAGLVAAFAFVLLVGFLAVPLVKLGRAFDETTRSIRELTEHSVPILDEAATTVASTNDQLVKVDTITTSAAQVSENVSALTGLYASTLGRPLVKVAAFSYGVRQAFGASWRKQAADDGGDPR
ncbi:hypothetical protein GCM10009718_24650 [Isoptericola halotolerans]|uniref:Uncharacterized protein YoxC n=1 Tax=Isoptericola halotolerans TaxID=300560 RepID=A0ABX2A7T1_9MICO|nr:DUF948 domain-containing protein [Isoptericola halotolerans]NOV97970.1 uncharacterized protein YoxC [Isoptericola halotolerans]